MLNPSEESEVDIGVNTALQERHCIILSICLIGDRTRSAPFAARSDNEMLLTWKASCFDDHLKKTTQSFRHPNKKLTTLFFCPRNNREERGERFNFLETFRTHSGAFEKGELLFVQFNEAILMVDNGLVWILYYNVWLDGNSGSNRYLFNEIDNIDENKKLQDDILDRYFLDF